MGQTADQLRQEIAHKRDDAAAKIDRIEAKVQDLPNLARETVRGSVDQSLTQVKDSVDQSLNQARVAVEEKVEKLKEQTDIQGQVEQRPLAALGIAFAGGYLLGKMFGGDKAGGAHDYQTDWSQAHSSDRASHGGSHEPGRMGIGSASQGSASHDPSQPNAVVSALKKAAHEAGLDNTLSALSGALVATLTDQFNRTIRETFPDFAEHLEQQGGLAAAGQSGGSSSGGSGMGGSSMGGSSMGGSSTGGSGSFGSGSGSGMAGSTLGGSGSSPSGSGSSSVGTSAYGQSENKAGV